MTVDEREGIGGGTRKAMPWREWHGLRVKKREEERGKEWEGVQR